MRVKMRAKVQVRQKKTDRELNADDPSRYSIYRLARLQCRRYQQPLVCAAVFASTALLEPEALAAPLVWLWVAGLTAAPWHGLPSAPIRAEPFPEPFVVGAFAVAPALPLMPGVAALPGTPLAELAPLLPDWASATPAVPAIRAAARIASEVRVRIILVVAPPGPDLNVAKRARFCDLRN